MHTCQVVYNENEILGKCIISIFLIQLKKHIWGGKKFIILIYFQALILLLKEQKSVLMSFTMISGF